jgi:hypothetical protein
MASKKNVASTIGLALVAIGIISLLQALEAVGHFQIWWLPIILICVGILVIINGKKIVHILGWVCLVYGALLLLITMGLFNIPLLWELKSVIWLLFGLIILL